MPIPTGFRSTEDYLSAQDRTTHYNPELRQIKGLPTQSLEGSKLLEQATRFELATHGVGSPIPYWRTRAEIA